ncbi:protein takeout-like [Neocloeon triangulifer]|uniref:protein takeout-like n=1 Tax=Neocloeon triangulifer TaxID=2078957 RepID=UPI00286FAD67|nr:protein takeout-like [Neocloeon triangulifer]
MRKPGCLGERKRRESLIGRERARRSAMQSSGTSLRSKMSGSKDIRRVLVVAVEIILVYLAPLATAESQRLPAEFLLCKASDADYNGCLKQAAQKAFVLLQNGVESLGIESINPLFINHVDVEQGSGLVRVALSLSNATLTGLDNIEVLSQSTDIASGGCEMKSEAQVPRFSVASDYEVSGKVMLLPITGRGKSNVTMNDINVKVSLKCERFMRDGEEFLNVTNFHIKFQPKSATMYLANLFGGDALLERAMNILLNENALEILREMNPAIEVKFGAIFRDISNKLFHKVPYKTIFLK